MRKLIFMAIAGYLWKRFMTKGARPTGWRGVFPRS